ncbi:unnamed protein product [Peronospora destructor]|nr:unnamed protein product [Peronospora destructor]
MVATVRKVFKANDATFDTHFRKRGPDLLYTGTPPDSRSIMGLVNSNACSVAMRHGARTPTAEQFNEMMTWRRDVNLARAAHKPFDGRSETFAVFTRNLRKAIVTTAALMTFAMTLALAAALI